MKVVHIVTTIDLGGAEKQLLVLATCQKEKGLDVEIIFLKGKPALLNDFNAAGIRVHAEFSNLNFFQQFRKLSTMRTTKNRVFHAHLPRAELLCSLSLKKGAFLVTRHNAEQFFPKAPKFISVLLSRFVLARAFASISISKAVSDFLRASFELSLKSPNYVIYYGLPKSKVSTKKLKQPQLKSLRIGTIARHVHQKNIPLLLETFKKLTERDTFDGKLFIVGVGPLTEELKMLSMNLGIAKSITWIEQTRDVERFYQSLDFFILTSHYEGFGLVLLEAMQQGIPVVARDISAIPEVLGEGHPGLLESSNPNEFASRILEMVTNRELLKECIKYQHKRLDTFLIDNAEISHRNLYKQLLSGRE